MPAGNVVAITSSAVERPVFWTVTVIMTFCPRIAAFGARVLVT